MRNWLWRVSLALTPSWCPCAACILGRRIRRAIKRGNILLEVQAPDKVEPRPVEATGSMYQKQQTH